MNNMLFFYFAIYTFLGWLMESVYRSFIEKRFINSGFLYGPFCPIYGFGATIMIIISDRLPKNVLIIFITSMILLTIWEYVVGWILEKIFKTKYWDYSHLKFNINGRICLKNSIYWGLLGIGFTFFLHPFIKNYANMIPENILVYSNIAIYTIFIVDVIVSVTKILFIDKKIKQLYEISDMIKEKIIELKKQDVMEKVSIENITLIISDLKEKQSILKKKLYKLIVRLKDAFPTMQSETISKFLNQRKEIKKYKKLNKKK